MISSALTSEHFGPGLQQQESGPSFVRVGDVVEVIAPALRERVERVRKPLEKAWVEFLKVHDWQWFGTFTYKDEIHPEAADKQFRMWSRLLDEANGVRERVPRDSARRCVWTRGLEWQKRGVLHYHALIGRIPPAGEMDRREAADRWLKISGGFARIDAASGDDVLAYVTKYTAKGGEVDFSPNLAMPDLLAGATTAA